MYVSSIHPSTRVAISLRAQGLQAFKEWRTRIVQCSTGAWLMTLLLVECLLFIYIYIYEQPAMREKKSKGLVSLLFSRGIDSIILTRYFLFIVSRLVQPSKRKVEKDDRGRYSTYIYHAECHRWNGSDRIQRRSKSEEPALFFFFSVRFVIARNGRIDGSVLTRSVQMVHGCIEESVEEQGGKYMYHNMDFSLS
jgi:hypothetical protein